MNPDHRLSDMSTAWTVFFQAHDGSEEEMKAARRQLLEMYSAPVYRYLLGAVRDPNIAQDLYQEFALKFVQGNYRKAHPDRGRFRDFLKTSLYHLVIDYQRHQKKQPALMDNKLPEPAHVPSSVEESDREFKAIWRAELLERVWAALREHERQTGEAFFSVLRAAVDHPELKSPQLAELVSAQIGKSLSAQAYRKRLHFARQKFASVLMDLITATLDNPTAEALEEELVELELLGHCRDALAQRHRGS